MIFQQMRQYQLGLKPSIRSMSALNWGRPDREKQGKVSTRGEMTQQGNHHLVLDTHNWVIIGIWRILFPEAFKVNPETVFFYELA